MLNSSQVSGPYRHTQRDREKYMDIYRHTQIDRQSWPSTDLSLMTDDWSDFVQSQDTSQTLWRIQ